MIIYKTTNLINGKIYVGKDVKNNSSYLGSGKILLHAIKKYGKINFKKEIIDTAETLAELSKKEIFWIDFYCSTSKKIGYNICKGGEGGDTITNNPFYKKKKFSKKHKENISKNHADVSGKNNPMFGKTHTQEVREILRIKNLNKKLSKSAKDKMSKKRKGELNTNSKLIKKQIISIRKEYSKGKTQSQLAKKYKVNKPCIWKILKKRTWKDL
jgi:group I intron endonuclease